ncbi:DUF2510 domain-containing protein [Mycolicibacterium elephantis]|uniref:DUF2510 domain-containing protein n=1 Tax=Mycolicibacterium elephantis TaxID=81858 RepID=UPI0007E9E658|nr:DUF2510 domain-containing protein [Mycolicibacterium elephantis]OBB22133.1 hypothetical protein A5762_14640 [Mycolicibacterium elephantis]
MTKKRYTLWCTSGGDWCEYDVVGESHYDANIRRLLPVDWDGSGIEIRRDFELIPEPENRHDPWAISVRADNRTVGYIQRADAPHWAGVVRRVCASGYIPVVLGRVYAFERPDWESWDGDGDPPKNFGATIQLKLGEPHTALPLNDPPAAPYTLLPRSTFVQVTKENEHAEALLRFVPAGGYGLLIATLHEQATNSGRSVVEVRLDDERIGQLTPQMSQRFLPLIQHLSGRGILSACWADITGSAVAAEVRISAIKANEATPDVLDGPAVEVQRLIAEQDVHAYQLGGDLYRVADGRSRGERARPSEPAATPPPLPPSGWYPDPRFPQYLRYWNGATWTEHTAPNPRSTP